jgi:hypothetical protein
MLPTKPDSVSHGFTLFGWGWVEAGLEIVLHIERARRAEISGQARKANFSNISIFVWRNY